MNLWLAADPAGTGTAGDLTSPVAWINYGVLGLVVIGGIIGWFHFKPEVDRLEADQERLRVDIVKLRDSQVDEIARVRAERDEYARQMREERDNAQIKLDQMADIYQTSLLPSLNKFLSTIEILMPLLQRVAERPGGDQR